mgnify:CR=1 FL=1|tara:strand:- start:6675 stop:7631 length:957 start_codon:yes stop_codon:yes gene_type:complete
MSKIFCLNPEYSTTRSVTQLNTLGKDNKTNILTSANSNNERIGGLRTNGYFKIGNHTKLNGVTLKPLITVITVVFNGSDSLEETILSVINQSYENIEYIVIDGGSTDDSIDIIRRYEHAIDFWISEKDGGIYDAMNKGIAIASGDWVNFMNGGDLFYSTDTIKSIFNNKLDHSKIIYGDVHIRYNDFTRIQQANSPSKLWQGMSFSHQSVFCDLKYHKMNLFNKKNKVCADLEFYYKAYKKDVHFKNTSTIISSVDVGGISESSRLETLKLSKIAVLKGGALPLVHLYYFYKYIDTLIRLFFKLILPSSWVKKLILYK